MKEYKYDIAISLCKQDVEYTRSLVKELNPKLNVFFYEDRQEELIGELGPEKFGDVFKKEARVVVILYRKEWSESYYTELERAAILDRTARPDQGQSFIMVIGMDPGEVPGWYPSSRIYANPMKFTQQKMAELIEYKLNERGGNITPLTFKEQADLLKQRINSRKAIVMFLQSPDSFEESLKNLDELVELIQERISLAENYKQDLKVLIGSRKFNTKPSQSQQEATAFLQISKYILAWRIEFNHLRSRHPHSQEFTIHVEYFLDKNEYQFSVGQDFNWAKQISISYKFNTDGNRVQGWSKVKKGIERTDFNHDLFFGWDKYYDLGPIISSEQLVEFHFKELFSKLEKDYDQILN